MKNNYISNIKSEYEANSFVAEFLIDDVAIDNVFFNVFSFGQLASSYYVPV
ncbi:hypothetical protein psyc5s11_30550 [Clostridium gelidum]|uniref:Uncharacterized protein n=1 Tax=Clostridium gelidum TaxID=704125 RepID=A0ABN6J1E5_9CLOT|nr:hypothetical protein psyc5s11_30550 [Clostridium gelidum]